MDDSGSVPSTIMSLFEDKNGGGLPRGCLPPVQEFDHQGRRRYEGVELWQVTPSSMPEVAMMNLMLRGSDGKTMIFSEEPHSINRTFEVMFKRLVKQSGPQMLKERNIKSRQIYEDVQEYLDLEWKRLNPLPKGYHQHEFNTYEQIITYLHELVTQCPKNFECSIKTIGKTAEGRNVEVFKIVPLTNTKLPVVWLDATRSAHNWLATASVVEILETVIGESENDKELKELIGSFEWRFLPVTNPDGYVYSWDKDRFHNKNRSPTNDPDCTGVDLDRNFDYKITDNSYTKFSACFDFYNGTKSEAETEGILAELTEIQDSMLIWINVKQGPWRITLPQSSCEGQNNLLAEVAKQARGAKHLQKPWILDENCNFIYKPAGTAMESIYSSSLAKYAFTFEIGGSTFDVTATDIPQSSRELHKLLLALTSRIKENEKISVHSHDEM